MAALEFTFPTIGYEHDDPSSATYDKNFQPAFDSVLVILTNYVQPDSNLQLNDAISQVAQFWDNTPTAVLQVPIAMAEQIPYDHPSHRKLADFVLALHNSNKCVAAKGEERFWDQFTLWLWDTAWQPEKYKMEDGEEPMRYANLCAFAAHLQFPKEEVESFDYLMAKQALCYAMRMDDSYREEVRCARVIAAAQSIELHVRTIYKEVLNLGDREAKFKRSQGWLSKLKGKRMERFPSQKFSLEEWLAWRSMFRSVAVDRIYSKECRVIAPRTADLMALEEKRVENDTTSVKW